MKTFILGDDGRTPVEVDQATFTAWITRLPDGKYPKVADYELWPGVRVLTQFTGTGPHGGEERVFDTLICGGEYDGYTFRTSSWGAAVTCHVNTINRLRRWVEEDKEPADFIMDIAPSLLVRWGFCPTDEGSEWERDLRGAEDVPGLDGLNLVVRPDDGAVCLQEYDRDGNGLCTVALTPQKTIGGVMRIVQALRHRED